MKHLSLAAVLALLLFTVQGYATPTKLAPHDDSLKLKMYFQSGEYYKDIEKKLVDAKIYLDQQLQSRQRNTNRIAIVLDIDETALSNFSDLERLNFSQNPQARAAAIMLSRGNAIPAVLDLYQHAILNNVAVFFISDRASTPEIMNATVSNLKSAGFSKWEELILKPLENEKQSTKEFKTHARRHIAYQGFDIVLNIGDQEEDLAGGYAQAKVKLPNPFYGN